MIVTQVPPFVHTAFNPSLVKFGETIDGTLYSLIITVDGQDITMKAESFNSEVKFDLSKVLSKIFIEGQTELVQNDDIQVLSDEYLRKSYTITVPVDGITISGTRYALNAVVQVGESPSFDEKRGMFLTRRTALKYYDGYDLSLGVLTHINGSYIRNDGTVITPNKITDAHCVLNLQAFMSSVQISNSTDGISYIQDADGETITTMGDDPIFVSASEDGSGEESMDIEEACIPVSPMYIRWVNDLAGYDYQMFSRRQVISNEIAESASYEPYNDDIESTSRTKVTISQENENTMQIVAGQLSENDYDVVRRLAYSPLIEYYDTNLEKWLGATIEKATIEDDTFIELQDLAFNLTIVKTQTQF